MTSPCSSPRRAHRRFTPIIPSSKLQGRKGTDTSDFQGLTAGAVVELSPVWEVSFTSNRLMSPLREELKFCLTSSSAAYGEDGKSNQYDKEKECSIDGHGQKSFLELSIVLVGVDGFTRSSRIACQSLYGSV